MQKRPENKDHAGLWEFPGGKIDHSETPVNALIREISEELALMLDPHQLALAAVARSPKNSSTKPIVIVLYTYLHSGGAVYSQEGAEIGWFTPGQIDNLPKPPLDIDLAQQLFGAKLR